MKNKYGCILAFILVAILIFDGCYNAEKSFLNAANVIDIGDYVFCVEEALGDQYNMRVQYSLKRKDGADIDPETKFESIITSGRRKNLGGTITYTLSEDRKAIWIEEFRSSSQKLERNDIYTITIKNLIFGEDSQNDRIDGEWSTTFKAQINEDHIELITDEVEIHTLEEDSYYLLSSVQISSMGIHLEMKIPENNIDDFAKFCNVSLILEDGNVAELDLHQSIRGKNAPFDATAEAVFMEVIEPDEIYAIDVCGYKILL